MGLKIHDQPLKTDSNTGIDEINITDSTGRVLHVKKPPYTTRFKILQMVSEQNANKSEYVSEIIILAWLYAIDGHPVSISSEREAEALLNRLDAHGHSSLLEGIIKITESQNDSSDKEKNLAKK